MTKLGPKRGRTARQHRCNHSRDVEDILELAGKYCPELAGRGLGAENEKTERGEKRGENAELAAGHRL